MFLVGGVGDVLRQLAVTLCEWIYPFIPQLYSVFYDLAAGRFFDSQIIKDFSTNIYVLVSVVMLFAFAVKLLQAIVNPDLLLDSKKGVIGVLKRAFIALFLIIIVPFAFNTIYELQDHIITNSLIEKLIVGIQTNDRNLAESTNAGQVLSATTLSGLLYPNEGATTTSDVLQSNYNSMINDDIRYLTKVSKNINEKYTDLNGNEEYVLHFDPLIAIIAGIFVVYMFVLFCFDTAFRMIKLAFLELTAPVSIMAYIYNGDEFLNKWFKETLGTFVALFIRVAALGLLIFALHRLPTFMDEFEGNYKFWVQLFIIVGILIFVKAAPDLVKTITGFTWKGGGISRRLSEMAIVGGIAQNAWKSVGGKVKGLASTAVGAGIAAAGAGVKSGARTFDNSVFNGKGRELYNKIKNNSALQAVAGAGSAVKAGATAGGGLKSLSAASKAWKDSGFAKQKANKIALQNAEADKRRSEAINKQYGLKADGNVEKGTAESARIKAYDSISKSLSGVSTKGREAIINKGNMDMIKSSIDNINKKKDDLISNLDTSINLAGSSGNIRGQQVLENFKGEIKNNANLDVSNAAQTIQGFVDNGLISSFVGSEMLKSLTAIKNTKVKLDADVSDLKIDDSKITDLADGKDTINMKGITAAVQEAESISKRAQAEVDKVKEASNEYSKTKIDDAIEAIDKINKQSVFDHNSSDKYKYEIKDNSKVQPNNNINDNGPVINVTPTGDGNYQTDSGIVLTAPTVQSAVQDGNVKISNRNGSIQPNNGQVNVGSTDDGNYQTNTGTIIHHRSTQPVASTIDNSEILDAINQVNKGQDRTNTTQEEMKKNQDTMMNNQQRIIKQQGDISDNVNKVNNNVNIGNDKLKDFFDNISDEDKDE